MKKKEHCQGCNICLVGANRFQNEMFVENMQKIDKCRNAYYVISNLSEIPAELLEKTERVLFFLDCFGLKFNELEALIQNAFLSIPSNRLCALFNLEKDVGIEREALQYGIRGFFYQDDSTEVFCKGIRTILDGEIWLSRRLTADILKEAILPVPQHLQIKQVKSLLTPREKEVLACLITGDTNKEIASKLHISEHTLRTHLNNIYPKINVKTRTQAVLWAEKNL